MIKNLPAMREADPWVGRNPWRREWQPTPVFLPGEFHRERNLAGYSLWGCKESDTTEQLILNTLFLTHGLSLHILSFLKNLLFILAGLDLS